MAEKRVDETGRATIHVDAKRASYTILPSTTTSVGAQKPRNREFTTIYLHVKTGTFRVQPYVMGPVNWTEYGEPTVLTGEQFDSCIGAAVLDGLGKFNKDVFNPALARRETKAEQRGSIKQHLKVHVSRLDTNEIKVSPLHRERGGYVGGKEDSIVVRAEDVPRRLAEAIRQAFHRAT
jgi:hypothetical protein